MGRRGWLSVACAALLVATPASVAAPVKPKNGLYQGVTGQYEPVSFKVFGRDTLNRFSYEARFGICDSGATLSTDTHVPIAGSGRFTHVIESFNSTVTLRGRFVSKTKARGRLVYEAIGKTTCQVQRDRVRFRVNRSEF